MDERTLRVLEFKKIVGFLSDQASCSLGRELAQRLAPQTDFSVISIRQQETSEACRYMSFGNSAHQGSRQAPLKGISDIRPLVQRAAIGALLEPSELLQIAETLRGLRHLRASLTEAIDSLPLLKDKASHLHSFLPLEEGLGWCLSDQGEVLSRASASLASARKQIRSMTTMLHTKAQSIQSDPAIQRLLQEPLVTIRAERFCFPVKAECRAQFGGIVHDHLASGATLFMEPLALVEMNNQLRQLRLQEEEEIKKVLRQLTEQVGTSQILLMDSLSRAGEIDLIFAKGQLSLAWSCSEPTLNTEGIIDLQSARHPLIGEQVVPVNVHLGEEFQVLVITGPNTGGKTVTLKTVGLLTLMAQSGLHIPAEPKSRLSIFRQIFADIGDEQSIEQSLSTFSSHLSQVVKILRRLGTNTLVLLDEIGAGTDPDEGTALAKSILIECYQQGARVIATTHYSELKTFAFNEAGMENACVEFDPETLRPSYRLLIGIPGSSNAFIIAQRLGMSQRLLQQAKSYLSGRKRAVEKAIRQLKRATRSVERESIESKRTREELEKLQAHYQDELAQLDSKRHQVLTEAEDRARELVRSVADESDLILRRLRAQQREGKETQKAKDQLKELKEGLPKTDVESSAAPPPVILKTSTVSPHPGRMSLSSNLQALRLRKALTFHRELNLVGKTVDEAYLEIDKYLDDAITADVTSVRIIHGRGTGALRKGVHQFLKDHLHVKGYKLASEEEGGKAVTVVELKD